MLDIKIIRANPELIKDNIKKRNLKLDLDEFLKVDSEKLDFIIKVDELRAIKNKVSKEIPTLNNEERPAKISEMKELWEQLSILEEKQKEVEQEWKNLYYKIPNILDEKAAIWNTDEDNICEEIFLDKTEFDFKPKTHYEIGEKKWWIDTEKWSEISGSRFWYLKWDLVLLQFAITNFVVSKLSWKGFEPILPPVLVKEKAMFGTWFLTDQTDGLYRVNPDDDDLHLVWTSEVPVTSYHSDEILDLEKPKMYVAYSPCFRKEAWSAWKDTKWILRWHQFDKVEMVCFCKASESQKLHDFMVSVEEEVWQELKIPYKKMNVCSGDLWNPAMKKYDLEAWMPGEGKYREVTSCSNIWEYQSRRLSIKYKDQDNKLQYAHTLNGTVTALGRCLIAIIENYQTESGDVKIPDILKPFMWGKEII
jgi:seryl-tRNA synthetase